MGATAVFISLALTAILLSVRSDARRPARPVQPISAAGDTVCSLPSETGMCRAHIPSYFYNSASGQCETFVYGGARGRGRRRSQPFRRTATTRRSAACTARLGSRPGRMGARSASVIERSSRLSSLASLSSIRTICTWLTPDDINSEDLNFYVLHKM